MRLLTATISRFLPLLLGGTLLLAAEEAKPASLLQTSLTVTNEFCGNLKGGLKTGSQWSGFVDLGTELNLARLGGPSESILSVQFFGIKNQNEDASFGDHTGVVNPTSSLHVGDALRVFNLFYRQTWSEEHFIFKIGQLAIDDDFMGSDYASLFINSAFGPLPTQVGTPLSSLDANNPAFPIFAVAAPGLYLQAKLSNACSLQLGIYHGSPGPNNESNHGFNWGSEAHPIFFAELGWQGNWGGHDSNFHVGFSHHGGRFDDFDRLASGADSATTRGLTGFYALQDLVLLKDSADKPRLGAFWRAGFCPQNDRTVVNTYGDLGLNWFGPFSGRSDDILGLGLSCTHLGSGFRKFNGTDSVAAVETTVELTYLAKLSAKWTLQLDLQQLFNPVRKPDSERRETATIAAIRTAFTF